MPINKSTRQISIEMCYTLLMRHTANLVMKRCVYAPKADLKNLFQERSTLSFEILKLAIVQRSYDHFLSAISTRKEINNGDLAMGNYGMQSHNN